jgi:hypothetical protein
LRRSHFAMVRAPTAPRDSRQTACMEGLSEITVSMVAREKPSVFRSQMPLWSAFPVPVTPTKRCAHYSRSQM